MAQTRTRIALISLNCRKNYLLFLFLPLATLSAVSQAVFSHLLVCSTDALVQLRVPHPLQLLGLDLLISTSFALGCIFCDFVL